MFRLRHVYKTYHSDHHILSGVNFEFEKRGLYLIQGESGSGKTTLFKLLTKSIQPTSGEIFLQELNINHLTLNEIADYRKKIGIVFQDFKLIPELNLFENIALPLKIKRENSKAIKTKVEECAKKLKIQDLLSEYPEYLSGGQQQKAAVARALIAEPQIIIADEPTGNLDKTNSLQILNIFLEKASANTLVIVATHDENLLSNKDAKIVRLEKGKLII